MISNVKEKIGFIVTAIILMVIVAVGLCRVYPTYQTNRKLITKRNELQERIESKKREIAKIADYQLRFRQDADFVEMVARQNHRVFPGELIFLFDD